MEFLLSSQIENDYLFVLDNGKIGSKQISNPKIWIFNLINDTLIKTIEIPIDMSYNAMKSGLLVEMAVYFPNEICLDNVIVSIFSLITVYKKKYEKI